MRDELVLLEQNKPYEYSDNNLEITFEYHETGTTLTIIPHITKKSEDLKFRASRDYRTYAEVPESQESKLSFWRRAHDFEDIGSDEKYSIKDLEPGREYIIHFCYMTSDDILVNAAFRITTVGITATLTNINGTTVYADLSCNYDYDLEYWSDQNPIIITEHCDPGSTIHITQSIQSLHYMTIFAQVKGMPDTKTEIPKIYIPVKYEGISVQVSGTTATMSPIMSGNVDHILYSITINNKTYSSKYGEPVKVSGLTQGTIYHAEVYIEYEDETRPETDFSASDKFCIRTYGIQITNCKTSTNVISGSVLQTVGAFGSDPLNLIEFEKLPYLVYTINSNGEQFIASGFDNDYIEATGRTPNEKYTLVVQLKECKDYDGQLDTFASTMVQMLKCVELDDFTIEVAATSLIITPRIKAWNESSSIKIYAAASNINNGIKVYTADPVEVNKENESSVTIPIYNLVSGDDYRLAFGIVDDLDNEIECSADGLQVRTYGVRLTVENENIHTTFAMYEIEYIDGLNAENHPQDSSKKDLVRSCIKDAKTDELISDDPIQAANGIHMFNLLTPNHVYKIYAWIEGMDGSEAEFFFITKKAASGIWFEESHTGDSITVTMNSNDDYMSRIADYIVRFNAKALDLETGEEFLIEDMDDMGLFEGLIPGHWYRITFEVFDNEGNSSKDGVIDLDTPLLEVLTYKLTFSRVKTSTKGILFVSHCNQDLPEDGAIEATIWREKNEEDEAETELYNTKILGNDRLVVIGPFKHDSLIKARMWLVNNLGSSISGTSEIIRARTKKLQVAITEIDRSNSDRIIVSWQAKANSVVVEADPFSGENIKSVLESCYCYNLRTEETLSEVSADSENGPITYYTGATRRSGVVVAITDNYNLILSPLTYEILEDGTVLIAIGDSFKRAIPFIANGGTFIKVKPYIANDGSWIATK